MKKIIVNDIAREKRFALLEEGKIEKLIIQQPKQLSAVGNIYIGIIEKVLPGMNAAFVNLGEGKSGYIQRDQLASFLLSEEEKTLKEKRSISSFVHQGEKLLVQIQKDPTGMKGPKLTGIIELEGQTMIYMPKGRYVAVSKKISAQERREELRSLGYEIKQPEEGMILRTTSEHVSKLQITEELQALRKKAEELNKFAREAKKPKLLAQKDNFFEGLVEEIQLYQANVEVIVDTLELLKKIKAQYHDLQISLHNGKENIFAAYRLEGEIEKSLHPVVPLQNGSYLVIDETEALTVIDVNTGKFSGKQHLQDTVFKTNLLAASEVARQIRLRDLAGIILIDFIDMKSEQERSKVLVQMRTELKKDDRQTKVIGFTPLGILQITRKRTKGSMRERLQQSCSVCEGTGLVESAETIAFRLERELYEYRGRAVEEAVIILSEDVKLVFCGEKDIHKKRLEEILGFILTLHIESSMKPFYRIKHIH